MIPTAKEYFDKLPKSKVGGEYVLTEPIAIKYLRDFAKLNLAEAVDIIHRAHKNNTHDMGWDEDYQNLIEQLNNQ